MTNLKYSVVLIGFTLFASQAIGAHKNVSYKKPKDRHALVLLKRGAGQADPTLVEGLHVVRLVRGKDRLGEFYQPILYPVDQRKKRNFSFKVQDQSRVALTTEGRGFAVSLPDQNQVLVGEIDEERKLSQRYSLPFKHPTEIETVKSPLGELIAVVHDNSMAVSFLHVGLNAQGKLDFSRLRPSIFPNRGPQSGEIESVKFSPYGHWIYITQKKSTGEAGGTITVCDVEMLLKQTVHSSTESAAYENSGCHPVSMDDSVESMPSKALAFSPDGLFVDSHGVVLWNSISGPYLLQPMGSVQWPQWGDVGPKEILDFEPLRLTNAALQGVHSFVTAETMIHPRNQNLIRMGYLNQDPSRVVYDVLSTENASKLGKIFLRSELEGSGALRVLEQDPGALNFQDGTLTHNGEFILLGREDTHPIHPERPDDLQTDGRIDLVPLVDHVLSIDPKMARSLSIQGFAPIDLAIATSTRVEVVKRTDDLLEEIDGQE